MILAGDIGGTKTYLGLFAVEGARVRTLEIASFKTRDFASLEDLVLHFIKDRDPIRSACFGIPGPVVDNCVEATNIPWKLNGYELARVAGIRRVYLINDLVATGFGLGVLSPEETLVLNEGHKNGPATSALVAAGTGLGECILHWNGFEHVVLPCEAGHSDFAPHDDLQIELLRWLHKNHSYVCLERVLSGPGLVTIYEFLRETGRGKEVPEISRQMLSEDPAAVIARAAQNDQCDLSRQALDVFLSVYGSEAGNLALRVVALGGIYIGGGIASKLGDLFKNGVFMKSFLEKDRMQDFMPQIPVRVVLNDRTGMLGAAQYALARERAESGMPTVTV
jgi:glucokinase